MRSPHAGWLPSPVHIRPPGPDPLCLDVINGWPLNLPIQWLSVSRTIDRRLSDAYWLALGYINGSYINSLSVTRSQCGLYVLWYKTNIHVRGFTVRLAGPKLWNAINTDIRGELSLNAFKPAYKNCYLALIIDDSNYAAEVVCILFFLLQPGFEWFLKT